MYICTQDDIDLKSSVMQSSSNTYTENYKQHYVVIFDHTSYADNEVKHSIIRNIKTLLCVYDIVKEISAPPGFITFSCDLNLSIIPISFSVALLVAWHSQC